MSNYVFLIDATKKAMNPIHPTQARKLLNSGKAAVFRRYPFTLILNREVENLITYPITLRIDPGSKVTGISLVNNREEVIWSMELEHRGQQIKDAILTRRNIRRARRSRNTRYRQARFLNRKRQSGWLAPSLMHRVLTTETWVKRLCKFAPITEIRQELVKFDTQKMERPEISGTEYQQGTLAGHEVREYLLEKWGRKCAYCGAKDVPLQLDHIHPQAKGGSNRVSNLALACQKCNLKKGTQDLKTFLSRKPDLAALIIRQAKLPLKDAAAVNSSRWKLFETLQALGLRVITSTGSQTKFNRIRFGFPKEHWIDAACVGVCESLKILTHRILKVKATGWGTRQLCRMNKFGFPCAKPRKSYDIGWRTGDIARHRNSNVVGRVVVQSEKRLEVRTGGKRYGGTLQGFLKLHSLDGYSYA